MDMEFLLDQLLILEGFGVVTHMRAVSKANLCFCLHPPFSANAIRPFMPKFKPSIEEEPLTLHASYGVQHTVRVGIQTNVAWVEISIVDA